MVVDVVVTGDGRGHVEVAWRTTADVAVEVAVGPTPEAVDHADPRTVPAGTTRTVLEDLGPGRHYVSVAPAGGGSAVVAAERLVRLEGTRNSVTSAATRRPAARPAGGGCSARTGCTR